MIHLCKQWSIIQKVSGPLAYIQGELEADSKLKWPESDLPPGYMVGLVLIGDDGHHTATHVFITDYESINGRYFYRWKSTGEINPHLKDIVCNSGQRCCILVRPL